MGEFEPEMAFRSHKVAHVEGSEVLRANLHWVSLVAREEEVTPRQHVDLSDGTNSEELRFDVSAHTTITGIAFSATEDGPAVWVTPLGAPGGEHFNTDGECLVNLRGPLTVEAE